MIGGHKLPSRSPPPISSPPKTKLRYQTPPTQKVPSLKSLTQPNLIDAPDLPYLPSSWIYLPSSPDLPTVISDLPTVISDLPTIIFGPGELFVGRLI